MPQSRNRPGHAYQKPATIPAKQRVKGRVIWAILFALFAILIGFSAFGSDRLVRITISVVVSSFTGYFIGKMMERDASKK